MTRKHYVAIAKIINEARNKVTSQGEAIQEIENGLSELFLKDNLAFNKKRFYDACNKREVK